MLKGTYEWDALYELKGMTVKEVEQWFKAHDEEEVEYSEDDECVVVGGYWSDNTIWVDFEDGKVRRWYRGEPWD